MTARRVLLAGWDAADWKVIRPLMDAGKMPNLRRLVQNGAMGSIATLQPPLSPMLWTSIATGKRPFKHGIHGFAEPTPDGRGVRPITSLSRKSKALWNILNQNGLRSVVIGWWPSHPAEPIDGVMISDHYHRAGGPLQKGWPLPPGAIHPAEPAATLGELRMHPDLLTPPMVEPFVPLAKEIDQDKDKRLAAVMRTLAECMSIHSAAAWLLDNQPWDFFAVYFDAIDHFSHGFMRYHPPRQPWINERDFELYHNVIARAYQLHDEMLGTLVEKAGEDTNVIVVSDHGFHPDHLRSRSIPDIPAGPAIEHRDFGVFAIGGPGIKSAGHLNGLSVLDVAPTVLSLYGLPVGEDMDGKVLSRAFVKTPEVSFIPSWEDVPGADGRHPRHTRQDPMAAHEALEQMIALGYIERPDEDRETAVRRTVQELRYNLGEAYQDGGRHREAHETFIELHRADPDEERFAVRLFVSCQALEMHDEMRRIVDDLDGRRRALFEQAKAKIELFRDVAEERAGKSDESRPTPDEQRELGRWRKLARFQPAVVDCLKAQVLIAEKRYAQALPLLERVREAHPDRPEVLLQIGDLYLRLHRWSAAQTVYEEALALDADSARAHTGLCRIALRLRKFSAAAHSALDALNRIHQDPQAHFLLGLALTGLGEYARAADAFRAAITFNPNFPEAHRRLAALLEKHLGDAESARGHRRLARLMGRRRARPARPVEAEAERESEGPASDAREPGDLAAMPPLGESLIVVTGLPRSGTSLLMQMLAAGGVPVLSDGLREADENNPRGYLEFEPVKNLFKDSIWLFEQRGRAVKIVAGLLPALPAALACRVILCERDLGEILDSQERMLLNSSPARVAAPERRRMLKDEYARTLGRVKAMLALRRNTDLLVVRHHGAISDPLVTAEKINQFLGGGLDVAKMAAAIDPALHRNRGGDSRR